MEVRTLMSAAPVGIPVVTGPQSTVPPDSLTITWTTAANAKSYDIWVDQIGGMKQIIRQTVTGTTFLTPAKALPNGSYRVWVATIDASGVRSSWSKPVDFQVNAEALSLVPRLTGPIGSISATSPTFTWTAAKNAKSYNLWVDQEGGKKEIIRTTITGSTSFTALQAMPPGTYHVWVQAIDAQGKRSAWSTRADFKILPAAVLSGSRVTVNGTGNADVISVSEGRNIEINVNGINFVFTPSQVTEILIQGQGGDDQITVNSLNAVRKLTLEGGDGDDTLTVAASVQSDAQLSGGAGKDRLTGGAGSDSLNGGEGNDLLSGGNGNDFYIFGEARTSELDTIAELAGGGTDTLNFLAMSTAITADLNRDDALATMLNRRIQTAAAGQAAFLENVTGGAGNDRITGNAASNVLAGSRGSDILEGGRGNDRYYFNVTSSSEVDTVIELDGNGTDTLDFSGLATTVNADLTSDSAIASMLNRIVKTGNIGQCLNIENLIGGSGDDLLKGNAVPNVISGGRGNDTLFGGGGADQLDGGAGENIIDGRVEAPSFMILKQPSSLVRTNVQFSGRVSDAGSGIRSLEAIVDDTETIPVVVQGDQFVFTTNFELNGNRDGRHSIRFRATDNAGNVTISERCVFEMDSQVPEFQLESPVQIETNDNVVLRGTTTAWTGLSGSNSLTVQVDDGPLIELVPDSTGHFSFPTSLPLSRTSTSVHRIAFRAFDRAGNESSKSIQLTLKANKSNATLVQGVLFVLGTQQDDMIRIQRVPQDESRVEVLVGQNNPFRWTFDSAEINAVQILGLDGNDQIDLSSTDFRSWVLGGNGSDTLIGGSGDDVLNGGGDNDTIFGNAGSDAIYGGEGVNAINGGDGPDHVSMAHGMAAESLDSTDIDIETMEYSAREAFNLMHEFRDAFGLIVSLDHGIPEEAPDAVHSTGLAAVAAALRGDDADTLQLLLALRDIPFVMEGGETRLIRHPLIRDYLRNAYGEFQDNSGNHFAQGLHSPLTRDGVIGVMAAVYYAWSAPNLSAETRAMAKDVLSKYVDFLRNNEWKTIGHYPDGYWQTDALESTKFANVFSLDIGAEFISKVMSKGPESYLLAPNDRYALQNVAAEMGLQTSHWNVWSGFASTLTQVIGDGYRQIVQKVADGLATTMGTQLDNLLKGLRLDRDYRFHVIPGVDWTEVRGNLSLEISEADRHHIVTATSEALRVYVRFLLTEILDPVYNDATEFPAFAQKLNDLLGGLVDHIVSVLPKWAGAEQWAPVVTSTLQNLLPWLNSNDMGELVAIRLSHEMAKMDFIVADLSFWPTLLEFETRPELVDLLGWSVNDLDGYLSNDQLDNDRSSSELGRFGNKNLYRMDMVLYGWLNGDGDRTRWWIDRFTRDSRFESLDFAWKKPHAENAQRVLLDGDTTGRKDTGRHRLDFLLLAGLDSHDRPRNLIKSTEALLRHWSDVLDSVANRAIDAVKRSANEAWSSIDASVKAFLDRTQKSYEQERDQLLNEWASRTEAFNSTINKWNTWLNDQVAANVQWLNNTVRDTYATASNWYIQERDRIVGDWGRWLNDNYQAWHNWLNHAIEDTYQKAADWLDQAASNGGGILRQVLGGFGLTGGNWLSVPNWGSLPGWAQGWINGYTEQFNAAVNSMNTTYNNNVNAIRSQFNTLAGQLNSHVANSATNWFAFPDWASLPAWAQERISGYTGQYNKSIADLQSRLDNGIKEVTSDYHSALEVLQSRIQAVWPRWEKIRDAGVMDLYRANQSVFARWQTLFDNELHRNING